MRIQTTTDLYSHQRDAVEKLLPTRVGALFMEMGTGKSRTAIELCARRCERISRVIWVCPVSTKITIQRQILTHTDTAPEDIFIFDETTTIRSLRDHDGSGWFIVGTESVSQSARVTLALNSIVDENSFVIVDESSYIKNPHAKRSRYLTSMCAGTRYRLILTGTPLTQGIVDLYSQLRFLSPKILGYKSWYQFCQHHVEFDSERRGLIVRTRGVNKIAACVAPYSYQVRKEECLDLPSKLYSRRDFLLTTQQKMAYEKAKMDYLLDLESYDEFSPIAIFRLFTALQTIACGFWNRHDSNGHSRSDTYPSNRLDTLLGLISEMPPVKVVIWARHLYSITEVSDRLRLEYGNDSVVTYTGLQNESERQEGLDAFRSGPARFFVATPTAGGYGLSLTEASTVVFYSNSFKYSERVQAEDRCHRIGQTNRVTYIDIVSDAPIEDRILTVLNRKENVAHTFRREIEALKKDKAKLEEWVKAL